MTSKEYLLQYKTLKEIRKNLLDEREEIVRDNALPPGIDYSKDRVQASPDDAMFKKILRIQRDTKEVDAKIDKIDAKMKRIRDRVNSIDDGELSRLLYLRYIESRSWVYVSMQLGYSEDHVRGWMHQKALKKIKR